MSKSKLIILGCGSSVGVPRIDGVWGNCKSSVKKNIRSRCSAIIIKGSNNVLIDASPDIRNQLLSNQIKNISSIIFTHEHADQTNGLFEVRPFFWRNKKRINIYGNMQTIKELKKRYDYLFKQSKSYPPIVKANMVKKKFSLGALKEKINFKSLTLKHGSTRSVVYIFEKTAYISDCNDPSITKVNDLMNLNNLIIDCLKFSKHPGHFNLEEALFVHSSLKPKKTILTNLHHDLDYNFLVKTLPRNVIPAFDNLNINL
jgi:phosphoribosyl 1,2-cyclic phosphate phosphodiesterase